MHYINGKYTQSASIAATDLGFLRGYGVFDYLRTYRKKPFHLEDHLHRLSRSAADFVLEMPHSHEEIAIILNTILGNCLEGEYAIRIVLTGGESHDLFLPEKKPTFAILTSPLKTPLSTDYEQGIAVATTYLQRSFPNVKTTYYAPAILALQKSPHPNVKEIIYLTKDHILLEASTANIFAIKKGELYTAPISLGILRGITRDLTLRLAREHLPVREDPISLQELETCDELFLTSSSRAIMPIIRVDTTQIGKGVVGPITQMLIKKFNTYTESNTWTPLYPSHSIEKENNSLGIESSFMIESGLGS